MEWNGTKKRKKNSMGGIEDGIEDLFSPEEFENQPPGVKQKFQRIQQLFRKMEYRFYRKENMWTIAYKKDRAHMPHMIGLSHIQLLLRHRGQRLSITNFIRDGRDLSEITEEIMGKKARNTLKQRLKLLNEKINPLQEAMREDSVIAIELREEIEEKLVPLLAEKNKIETELRNQTGLNGRSRKFNSPAENARKAIDKNIKDAMRIMPQYSVSEDFIQHLAGSLSLGRDCSYLPKEKLPWIFDPPY